MSIVTGQKGRASDFVDTSAGASDAGKGIKLNASGELDSSFFSFAFGDGSDGDVTISSPTTITKDMFYNNLVVNSTLSSDGFRIFVKGTLSGSGTIQGVNGANGSNGSASSVSDAGGAGGAGGGAQGTGWFKTIAGGNGAGGGGRLGNGGVGANGTNGNVYQAGKNGGRGGDGVVQTGGNGGTGGTYTANDKEKNRYYFVNAYLKPDYTLGVLATPSSAGGGGGGGNFLSGQLAGGGGGGGGASGGGLFIGVRNWAGTFVIKSTGGNGGNGGNGNGSTSGCGSGGGGGNGGYVVILYAKKTWAGSYNLAGGTKGAKGTALTTNSTDAQDGATGISYEIPATQLI